MCLSHPIQSREGHSLTVLHTATESVHPPRPRRALALLPRVVNFPFTPFLITFQEGFLMERKRNVRAFCLVERDSHRPLQS